MFGSDGFGQSDFYRQSILYHPLTIKKITLTLKMTSAQVVETSVTVTNSPFQGYTHQDDHARQTTDLKLGSNHLL